MRHTMPLMVMFELQVRQIACFAREDDGLTQNKIGSKTFRYSFLLAIQQPRTYLDMHDNCYAPAVRSSDRRRWSKGNHPRD